MKAIFRHFVPLIIILFCQISLSAQDIVLQIINTTQASCADTRDGSMTLAVNEEFLDNAWTYPFHLQWTNVSAGMGMKGDVTISTSSFTINGLFPGHYVLELFLGDCVFKTSVDIQFLGHSCSYEVHCTDGIRSGNETGVDCGGSCPPCGSGGSGPSRCSTPTKLPNGYTQGGFRRIPNPLFNSPGFGSDVSISNGVMAISDVNDEVVHLYKQIGDSYKYLTEVHNPIVGDHDFGKSVKLVVFPRDDHTSFILGYLFVGAPWADKVYCFYVNIQVKQSIFFFFSTWLLS